MPKTSKFGGPTIAGGTAPRQVITLAGVDLDVRGSVTITDDLAVSDDLTVGGIFSGVPAPTQVVDEAVMTTATAELVVNAFVLTPVPNLVVTAPDSDDPLLVRLRGPVINTPTRTQATVGTTNGSPAITGPANAFSADDIGRNIAGTGIPANTRIVTISSETAAVISNNATATGSITATLTGGPSMAALCIADEPTPDIGEHLDVGSVQLVNSSAVAMSVAEVWLDPHSPGTFYAMAYSLSTGTLRVDAADQQKARMQVLH